MPDSSSPSPTPNCGLDAPGALRNLFIAANLWSGKLALGPFSINLAPMSLGVALGGGFMGVWMAWDSKVGKVRERERLLDLLTWTGRECGLDVGWGRGLLLVAAAKRLTSGEGGGGGSAAGIDLWPEENLAGNRPEATLEN